MRLTEVSTKHNGATQGGGYFRYAEAPGYDLWQVP